MNRYVLIALAIIVPFCALVAWGLMSTRDASSSSVPSPAPSPAPVPAAVAAVPVPVVAAVAPVAPAAAPTPAPAEVAPAKPAELVPVDTSLPEPADADARRAVLEQVTPAVQGCIDKLRPRKDDRVMTGFDVKPDGSLTEVRVKTHGRAPALIDCITKALQASHVDPAKGIPKSPMRHAFEAKGR
jgi:hypothetical protein